MSASNQKSGMAITSLVLGVLSLLCFGFLAGIPAIILGHIAHNRSRKLPEEYGGGGLATAGFIMGYLSIVWTMLVVAMLFPALAKAKERAQEIRCAANMRVTYASLRAWQVNHGGQWPFNVSTNRGGTMELCLRDDDGVDRNAALHLRALSGELASPNFLVCPADTTKQSATSIQELQPDNLSYQLRTGADVNAGHPEEILLRCPIHGNILRCNGSIELGRSQRRLR
jgi:hypothetical protein